MKNILVITDNEILLKGFLAIINKKTLDDFIFHFRYSFTNIDPEGLIEILPNIKRIDIKKEYLELVPNFSLIISLHCKQIFPLDLITKVKCINIHPGYNPFNRGWYPQVFSIINKLPLGVTIHEIDEQLDHGKIICQKKVRIFIDDTSKTTYDKVIKAELELIDEFLEQILKNDYIPKLTKGEGNLNLKKDFAELCEIKLEEKATYGEVIDRLRALTHGDFKNAYFYDKQGNKIYISIKFKRE